MKFPTCSQSSIEREWLANFYLALVNHGFSCPIGISSDGMLSFGNCATAKNVTIARPPSGTLTIDRTCHVVGSITYVFTDDQWGGGTAGDRFRYGALRTEAGCWNSAFRLLRSSRGNSTRLGCSV